jgi:hypothetical protein
MLTGRRTFMRLPCTVPVILALLCGCKSTGPPSAQVAPLDSVLTEVQGGLQKAQDLLDHSKLPKLKSVQLTLHTQVEKDATGKITIYVISFGGGPSVSSSQDLVLTLTPPEPKPIRAVAGALPTVADSIVELITKAAEVVDRAETGTPSLQAKSLTLELAFTVTRSVKGGLQFNLGMVSADVGGSIKDASQQRITITFERPPAKT